LPHPRSAVEPFAFRGRTFFLKRDDTIDPLLSGNKFRKLQTLVDTPPRRYRALVSHGGSQSNAMLSIAALCHRKGWRFTYYTRPLSTTLRSAPSGNLEQALALGMELVELDAAEYDATVSRRGSGMPHEQLFIPQGGADPLAQKGVGALADEIACWQRETGIGPLVVVTPSGTGTTAFYLAGALGCEVLTTPAVGNREALETQMRRLGTLPPNLRILEGVKKHHFGRPYAELYAMYAELLDAGVAFDLLYGAKMWYELMQHLDEVGDRCCLYVHSGGLIGNASMLERYRYKGLIRE